MAQNYGTSKYSWFPHDRPWWFYLHMISLSNGNLYTLPEAGPQEALACCPRGIVQAWRWIPKQAVDGTKKT